MELFVAPLKQERCRYATEANINAGIHGSKCQVSSAALYTFWTADQVIFHAYVFLFGRLFLVLIPGMDRTIPQDSSFLVGILFRTFVSPFARLLPYTRSPCCTDFPIPQEYPFFCCLASRRFQFLPFCSRAIALVVVLLVVFLVFRFLLDLLLFGVYFVF